MITVLNHSEFYDNLGYHLTLRVLSMFWAMLPISKTGCSAADISAIICTPNLAPFPTWSTTSATCLLGPKTFQAIRRTKSNARCSPSFDSNWANKMTPQHVGTCSTPTTLSFPAREMYQLPTRCVTPSNPH